MRRALTRKFAVAIAVAAVVFAFLGWQLYSPASWLSGVTSNILEWSDAAAPKTKETVAEGRGRAVAPSAGTTDGRSSSNTALPDEDSFLTTLFKNRTPVVCGLSADEAKAFIALGGEAGADVAQSLMAEIMAKLIQSDKLRDKTLGLYAQANRAGWAAVESEKLNSPGCKQGEPCAHKHYDALQEARATGAEPIVKLALNSGDANVYAAALYACEAAKGGTCGLLSYERFATLDPDNAVAWLMVASAAEKRKDEPASVAALQRASSAKNFDTRVPPLGALYMSPSVQGASPLEKASVGARLISMNGLVSQNQLLGVGRYCGSGEAMNEVRREMCNALASKIEQNDTTLMGLRIATRIGERVGWSAERLQALKDEYSFAEQHMLHSTLDENMFSCDSFAKQNQWMAKSLASGERAVVQEAMGANGKSVAMQPSLGSDKLSTTKSK
jgi:hypothetical protein